MQLMQQYVQKSSSTTCPLRSLIEIGFSVLIHPLAPVKSGVRHPADVVVGFHRLSLAAGAAAALDDKCSQAERQQES